MRDLTPQFAVGQVVWVNPSNSVHGWYAGTVVHILRHDIPLQNGAKPGFEGNLYIVEISTHVDDYLTMFQSGRLHRFPHCTKNTVLAGEHECFRDVQREIDEIDYRIQAVETRKKELLRADENIEELNKLREELVKKL